MIRALAVGEGKTILVSSHILTELAEMCDRVGIIEKGKLLATGSVDDIKRQQEQGSEIRVRVLERIEECFRWLEDREDVEHARVDGELLLFKLLGDKFAAAALLKELVHADFVIAEFSSQDASLEDIFMQVTRGVVQ